MIVSPTVNPEPVSFSSNNKSPFAEVPYFNLPVVPLVDPETVSANVKLVVFAPVKLTLSNTSLGLLITLDVPDVFAI